MFFQTSVLFLTSETLLQGAEPERADSKVLSDEEVEEAEASDSFPALGYPAGIGSIGSGKVLAGRRWHCKHVSAGKPLVIVCETVLICSVFLTEPLALSMQEGAGELCS